MELKPGTAVRWRAPTCEGTVARVRRNDQDEIAEILVAYKDADGGDQQRWFKPDELTTEAQQ